MFADLTAAVRGLAGGGGGLSARVGDRGPMSRGPEEAAQHVPSCPDGMLETNHADSKLMSLCFQYFFLMVSGGQSRPKISEMP